MLSLQFLYNKSNTSISLQITFGLINNYRRESFLSIPTARTTAEPPLPLHNKANTSISLQITFSPINNYQGESFPSVPTTRTTC
jgi:hypothetical protein